jgi:hypothetical protein
MALNLPQTVQLYTAYIRFRYYLEESLGLSPAGLVLHYPLRCPGANTAGAAPSDVAGEAAPPQTPQQQALCHAAAKRKTPNMIYSEEIALELHAYRLIGSCSTFSDSVVRAYVLPVRFSFYYG